MFSNVPGNYSVRVVLVENRFLLNRKLKNRKFLFNALTSFPYLSSRVFFFLTGTNSGEVHGHVL